MTACRCAVIIFLLSATSAFAQEPVAKVPDALSYATAFVNPTIATVDALRSDHKWCELGRLGISEAVGNGATLLAKHLAYGSSMAQRPCAGCVPDGWWSGHMMNSTIGAEGWRYVFSFTTGGLRVAAHRHTASQVAIGFLAGVGANFAGQLLKCQ
jgi:hypothetical protein